MFVVVRGHRRRLACRMLLKTLSRICCRLLRWKVIQRGHEIPTPCVVVAAPHTSNWDFFPLLATAHLNDVHMAWLGKKQMFKGPLGPLFRSLGGIAVDRDTPSGLVGELVSLLQAETDLVVVVPVEGTRKATEYWKSGFYRIASEAGVPIQLAYVDGTTRSSGFGPSLNPSGDVSADMDVIRAFYHDKTGLRPSGFSTPRLREEDLERST